MILFRKLFSTIQNFTEEKSNIKRKGLPKPIVRFYARYFDVQKNPTNKNRLTLKSQPTPKLVDLSGDKMCVLFHLNDYPIILLIIDSIKAATPATANIIITGAIITGNA